MYILLKNVYWMYTIMCFIWNFCMVNVLKYVHSLKKWMLNRHSYIRWVYMIVYNYTLFEKCVPWMYKIIYIIQKTSMNYTHIIKIVYIESTKFHILFENCVHFFEKWVYIYIYCGDNFCFKGQGLDHVETLDNFVVPHRKESLPFCTL